MRNPAYRFGVFVSTAVLFDASPSEGTWKFNAGKSNFGDPARFVEGGQKGLALNFKRVDERTLDWTYTMDGKQVGFSHLTVSTDGKLMRVDSTATDAQGKGDQATVFLDRQ
jgi:hypothetical protein